MRGANLQGANLRSAKLSRSSILREASLRDVDLSGADLQHVNFEDADLCGANLREANLQGADLSSVTGGLRTEQLAGVDLSGAKLPKQLETLYDKLENVKGISESARKIFLTVLAGCLYCWLTIATTTDVNLITNRASSPLPIIQTAIPIVGFYVVVPLLVLCVYFYFHFYLQKLWEELGSLPAVFHDGRPLHTKVDPWLLNDLVRSHLPKLNLDRPFLSYLQLWISVLLAWWVVPITMFLFWGRYLRRHEQIGTAFHVVLLVLSIVAAVCLYRLAVATLRGAERKGFAWKRTLTSRRTYQTAAIAVAAGIVFGLVSVGAIRGVRLDKPIFGIQMPRSEKQWEDLPEMPWEKWWEKAKADGRWTWVPRAMALIGNPPFANLDGAEVSQKKPNWTSKKTDNDNDDLDSVIRAQLRGANLRYASAERAFFAGADLDEADLTGADLGGAKLSIADLWDANLTFANLSRADLSHANLSRADLSGANLIDTDLTEADLKDADLTHAILVSARLSGANLTEADLTEARLSDANLTKADLTDANLTEADLTDANLSGAYLSDANLSGAYLSGADLTHANLSGADLSHANLVGADLSGAELGAADLSDTILAVADLTSSDFRSTLFDENTKVNPEAVKRAQHWDKAFYDCEMIEALHLPLDNNVKLFEELPKDQQDRYKIEGQPPEPCPPPKQ